MAGSSFGEIYRITTWGESHGEAIGVVIDGCPANLELSVEDIQPYLNRRKPGQSSYATPRKEEDIVEILSGVFEGKTTGTPISLIVRNTSQHSADYGNIATTYRPGHADYGYDAKYGFRDYRGGGRSSGRETIGRVAAGAVAIKLLKELGINVCAYTSSIADFTINQDNIDMKAASENPLYMPDAAVAKEAMKFLDELREWKDSAGGTVDCVVTGVPAGVGEPVFDKLDAELAKGIMSIGAVKAVEIGEGTDASYMIGSDNNDSMSMKDDRVVMSTNHAGGIIGGISNGADIKIRATFKPTPSIFSPQKTVNASGEEVTIKIRGRHDPVVVPRAVVVVETMTAIVVLDELLRNMSSDLYKIKDFYK